MTGSLGKAKNRSSLIFEKYREAIAVLREKYKEQIEIHTGVEIGLKSDAYEENVALSNRSDLEYCIGSIHLVENMDPYYPDFWESYGEENGLKRYFETTYEQLKNLGESGWNTWTFGLHYTLSPFRLCVLSL